ncbi:sensor histidine kinase [Acidicapsa acidisoli]|uniref:sensor histidine kinase n=1 Tax=Acidicapsa acidisoli TaxID=1615681 RepID=UPI0021E08A19|nr:ATP-binding protein [Acidicapsa acidisoli]
MSLKTKLVLAITGLVFLVTGVLSVVYVSRLLQAVVQQSYDTNVLGAEQIRYALRLALEAGLKDQQVNPNDQVQLRQLAATAVRESTALSAVVKSVVTYSPTVYDISIGDNNNRALLTTGIGGNDQLLPPRTSYLQLRDSNAIELLKAVYGPSAQVYDVVLPLERNDQPFATVRVGVRTTLLRAVFEPLVKPALTLMGLGLATALVVAFFLGNLALRPMEELNMQLDYWSPVAEEQPSEETEGDTVVRVANKIERIGQRMRNVEEVFSALKENLDQVLGNLQDGILLFTGDGRAVLISDAVNRFLHVDRNELLGLHAREIFDRTTILGRTIREAWDARVTLVQEEIVTESGNRIEVSLDFIHDDPTRQGLGALLTLHDTESVEVIESELELSRRMAAIGRLTSGVGHEVKNPINAIVVHLELLKTKLGNAAGPANRHLDVIDSEIHRLDRVVQTLVDFSRPVEVKLVEYDLRYAVSDVATLAEAEMSTKHVKLTCSLPNYPLVAKVDVDLLKQAVLNVVQNGAQAMPDGGRLDVILLEDGKSAVIQVEDEGGGIAEELRERIFDLYFTTKKGGSGIGLAMTYRILQLHHGSIDVQSELGRGSVFQLRIPLSSTDRGRRHPQPTVMESVKGLEG